MAPTSLSSLVFNMDSARCIAIVNMKMGVVLLPALEIVPTDNVDSQVPKEIPLGSAPRPQTRDWYHVHSVTAQVSTERRGSGNVVVSMRAAIPALHNNGVPV